jgi:hypothetical protein
MHGGFVAADFGQPQDFGKVLHALSVRLSVKNRYHGINDGVPRRGLTVE